MGGFEQLLGFQFLVFWAHRQMSIHGGFLLHSKVLTTWPPRWRYHPIRPNVARQWCNPYDQLQACKSTCLEHKLDGKQTCDWRVTSLCIGSALIWHDWNILRKSVWVRWQPLLCASPMIIVVNKSAKPQLPCWDSSVVSSRRLWLHWPALTNELKQRTNAQSAYLSKMETKQPCAH